MKKHNTDAESKRTATKYIRPFSLNFTEDITVEELNASDPVENLKAYEKSGLKKLHDASHKLLNSGHSKLGEIAFGAIDAEQELTNTLEQIDEMLLQEMQVGNPKTVLDLTPRQTAIAMIDGPFQMLCVDAQRKAFDDFSVSTALGLGAALMRLAIENPGADFSDKLDELLKRSGAMAADTTETHRLLHRTLRKVEGVPPVLDKLALAGKDMAAATQQFRRTVKMDDDDWEIYNQMELRGHNQTRVARDLGMEPYQISRAWKRIKAAWEAAGYPIAEKVTMGNAVLGEDGVVFKKPTKRRKGRG